MVRPPIRLLFLGAVLMLLIAGQDVKTPAPLSADDTALVTELARRSFQFFWDASDPDTGITREHLYWNGEPYPADRRDVGSTGATGFGITALCIGAEHGWIPRDQARERVLNTLRFYADKAKDEHGWFYHFINAITGERNGNSEVSVSDSTWLFAG